MISMTIFVQQKKKLSINFTKANTKFSLGLHYNCNERYMYLNKTEICKFKTQGDIPWCEFCLGSISIDFTKYEVEFH